MRLYNLDYLRGLAAFGIMFYHYTTWTFGHLGSDTFLGRVGIYGVSVFYVLSGLTLFYVYHEKMKASKIFIASFFRKRFFRIFPLFWLASIATILLSRDFPGLLKLSLNLSGLFGFVAWDQYIADGAWSIGNELVFYVFFPALIFFMNRSKSALIIFSAVIFLIYAYFAFVLLDRNISISEQWRDYVNPLNQVGLFTGGFLIGYFFKNVEISTPNNLLIIFVGMFTFALYPVDGDLILIVTGLNRIIFTGCCFLVCIGFYKTSIHFPTFIDRPLKLLGEASYSVYFLHSLIYGAISIIMRHLFTVPVWAFFSVSIVLTICCSYFVYQKFEKYFIKLAQPKQPASVLILTEK